MSVLLTELPLQSRNNSRLSRHKTEIFQLTDEQQTVQSGFDPDSNRKEQEVHFPMINQNLRESSRQGNDSRNGNRIGGNSYIMIKQNLQSNPNDYSIFDDLVHQKTNTLMSTTVNSNLKPYQQVHQRNFSTVIGNQKTFKLPIANPYQRTKRNSFQRSFDIRANIDINPLDGGTITGEQSQIKEGSSIDYRTNFQPVSYALKDRLEREKAFKRQYADMFADHTIQATTLRRERLAKSIERMKEKAQRIQLTQLEHLRKQEMLNIYVQQFGIRVSPREVKQSFKFMGEMKLKYILESRLQMKRQHMAATIIQKNVKGHFRRQQFQKVMEIRTKAAKTLQKSWRNFRWLRLLPKMRKLVKNQAATTIQRYLRGYSAYKYVFKQNASNKLNRVYDFFSNIRNKLLLDSQVKIAYHWRKHKKLKQIKLEKKRQQDLERQQRRKKPPNYMLSNKEKGNSTKNSQKSTNNVQNTLATTFSSVNTQKEPTPTHSAVAAKTKQALVKVVQINKAKPVAQIVAKAQEVGQKVQASLKLEQSPSPLSKKYNSKGGLSSNRVSNEKPQQQQQQQQDVSTENLVRAISMNEEAPMEQDQTASPGIRGSRPSTDEDQALEFEERGENQDEEDLKALIEEQSEGQEEDDEEGNETNREQLNS